MKLNNLESNSDIIYSINSYADALLNLESFLEYSYNLYLVLYASAISSNNINKSYIEYESENALLYDLSDLK